MSKLEYNELVDFELLKQSPKKETQKKRVNQFTARTLGSELHCKGSINRSHG